MSGARLAEPWGSRIDRGRAVAFTFNGRPYQGFHGDTLASALLANGVQLVGRSFKLHRPRGIFSCGVEEPTALVDLGEGARRTPNVRATMIELEDGLVACSVNCWPGVGFDLGAVNGWFSAMLPAGFYYKTFKWPDWHLFEPAIRRMAGLGRASGLADPDRYEEIAADADVLVIGGGVTGLSAALAAAENGAKTLLLTGGAQTGGVLGRRADHEVRELAAAAEDQGVRILRRTMAFGIYDHNLVCACETLPTAVTAATRAPAASAGALRERLWKIRARAIILAAGAFERPMLFPDNDRPGVMLAGAAEAYVHAFGVACGRRVVIAANSDSAYGVAATLRAAGVEVVAVLDRRPAGAAAGVGTSDARAPGAGEPGGSGELRVLTGAAIAAVAGGARVRGCTVATVDGSRRERLPCDLILSAGGFAPAVHLHSQAGGRLRWVDEASMFVPDGAPPGITSVGACAGVFARDRAVAHAIEAGAARARGLAAPAAPVGGAGLSLAATHWRSTGKQFVDLQNDVTLRDVGLAALENYRSVEHLKRYTTTGMATDQGKTSNVNALVLMGGFTNRGPAEVGTTRFRPPYVPVSLGALIGRRVGPLYRPLKRLPAETWHAAHGALFEQFGNWRRPAAYPAAGESLDAAAQREAGAVRRGAGMLDGSPLGKLEIFGVDAARFLDLMYVGTLSDLPVGHARYGLLLNENGIVVDDGIVARMGGQRFWVNTTSAGVERTTAAFEEWLQCEYSDLKVLVTPVTSRWGNVTVAGPKAWAWLASVGLDDALAPSSMRHMTLRDSVWEGIPLRVLRASFSGELGYEVNLPATHIEALLDRLWAKAADFGGVLYGIEALEILRTEKGYIHVGTDTDGTTLPGDIGFARALGRKAANFVGRRSLLRPAALDPNRLQLVALAPVDGKTRLPVGAQIAAAPQPTATEGHVTSSYWSPELQAPVAQGLLARGARRLGERVLVHHLGSSIAATVVQAPFIDPGGTRLNG